MRKRFTHRPLYLDRASSVLDLMKRQRGWQSHLDDARVFALFMEVAGEKMGKHCNPIRLDRGELTVAVDSATWRQQMAFLVDDLRKRLNAALGDGRITHLRLVHGRPLNDELLYKPATVLPPLVEVSDADRKSAAALHDSCEDKELGEIVASAFLASRRSRHDRE